MLKFHAFSQDQLYESTSEAFRIRACFIYFYLEDGTMMVSEPKMENSGMVSGQSEEMLVDRRFSGTLVKRHRIPKPKSMGRGPYSFEDLQPGAKAFSVGYWSMA